MTDGHRSPCSVSCGRQSKYSATFVNHANTSELLHGNSCPPKVTKRKRRSLNLPKHPEKPVDTLIPESYETLAVVRSSGDSPAEALIVAHCPPPPLQRGRPDAPH